MIPYNLIFSGLKGGFNIWQKRNARKAAMKHKVELEEISNGNIRAKRKLSALVDVVLGGMVLAPFAILLMAPFFHTEILTLASDYINHGLTQIPSELWYLMYMVIGGNFGVSVSNILSNKAITKKINKEK